MFGDFVSSLRRDKEITLREFCFATKVNAQKWAKIERNIEPPPSDETVLATVATVLGVERGSAQWTELFGLAKDASTSKRVELTESVLANTLPLFCRKRDDKKPTAEELRGIAELLKHG